MKNKVTIISQLDVPVGHTEFIEKVEHHQEFHPNGQLAYEETRAILRPEAASKYGNIRRHPDGYHWMRIGDNKKYHDNGVVAWHMFYDMKGEVVKDGGSKPRRKDGSFIIY